MFEKLDKRLYDYLLEKSNINGLSEIKITHKQIAEEIGTAGEVVSRILKKPETNNQIEQGKGFVKLVN